MDKIAPVTMSDLVERLRAAIADLYYAEEAADRIEKLERRAPQQLRDTFAAHALTGLYAAYAAEDPPPAAQMAEWAYQVAEAMMKERAKRRPDEC